MCSTLSKPGMLSVDADEEEILQHYTYNVPDSHEHSGANETNVGEEESSSWNINFYSSHFIDFLGYINTFQNIRILLWPAGASM